MHPRDLPKLSDPGIPLRLTEGVKKQLSAIEPDRCTISLPGVDGGTVRVGDGLSVPSPDWDAVAFEQRIVLIEFDSDAATNEHVQGAERRRCQFVLNRGGIPIVVRIPPGPHGEKQGIDDLKVAGGNLRALEDAAIAATLATRSWSTPTPTAGSDGADTCRGCAYRDTLIDALDTRIAEYKASDELVRHGPFSPDEALVVKHLVTVASAAKANGKERMPLLREEVARLALGDEAKVKTVSRAFKAYKVYQDDPELQATLPFRLKWDERGPKTHIELYPVRQIEAPAKEYMTLRRLPSDRKPPARVLERSGGCRRCDSPQGVERRGVYRCLNEACGHTWQTRPVILGREDVATITRPKAGPSLLADTLPGQIVPAKSGRTYAGQIVPATAGIASLIPASFVSPHDVEAAASPHYQVVDGPVEDLGDDLADVHHDVPLPDPPPAPPPPSRKLVIQEIAPLSDRWYRSKARRRQEGLPPDAMAGGSE